MRLQCNRLRLLIFGVVGLIAFFLCYTYAPVDAMAYATDSTDGRVAYTTNRSGEDRKIFYNVQDAINDGYNEGRLIYMCSDWCLDETLGIADSKSVYIFMYGHKITNNCNSTVIRLYENARLYLLDDAYTPWYKINMRYTGRSSGSHMVDEYWNAGATTEADGLVTGGVGDGDKAGGIWMEDCSLLYLRGVSVAGNANIGKTNVGGGVTMEQSCNLIMHREARIQDNYGTYGGGVGVTGTNNNIWLYEGSSIDGNTAKEGGGIYSPNEGTRIHLELDSNISNNTAALGGGVSLEYGWNSISSDDKTGFLQGNRADSGYGGAVKCNSTGTTCGFYGVTFNDNTATTNGGALYLYDREHIFSYEGNVTIEDCTIVNNRCSVGNGSGEGGGVYADDSVDVNLRNKVIIKDNSRSFTGVADDLFLGDSNYIFTRSHSYILGGATEGSDVRVRTGMTKDQRIGKHINTYASGIYKMDIDSYWVTKGDDYGGDLWQRSN